MAALAELNQLISLMEARIPANQASPKNVARRKRLQSDLRKYFKSLDTAFPYSKLATIYNRYVEKE